MWVADAIGLKAQKGYKIGPASKLQIGDVSATHSRLLHYIGTRLTQQQVFEFLWADCPEFEYEWKCLGYTRFIVLRHSDSFPMHCACVCVQRVFPLQGSTQLTALSGQYL